MLRTMTPADVTDRVVGWFADPELTAYLRNKGKNFTEQELKDFVTDHDNVSSFMLGIFDQETRLQIGWFRVLCDDGTSCSSRAIADPAFRGRGLDQEAFAAYYEFIFGQLKQHRHYGTIYFGNKAGHIPITKYGSRVEGVRRRHKFKNETWHDLIYDGLLVEDWRARKADGSLFQRSAPLSEADLCAYMPISPVANLVQPKIFEPCDTLIISRQISESEMPKPGDSTAWQIKLPVRIETRGTVLYSMSRSDVTERFVGWFNDPQVMAYDSLRGDWSNSRLQDLVSNQNNKSKFILAICAKESGEPIGWVTIHAKRGVGTRAVVLGDQRYQGGELELEATHAVDHFLYDILDVQKVSVRPGTS